MALYLNRTVLVLRPKEPFVRWANSSYGTAATDYDEVHENDKGPAFLIPTHEAMIEHHAFVARNSDRLFEAMLHAWDIEQSSWPSDRGYSALTEWFDIEYHSEVFDFGGGPFAFEEL